MAGGYGGRDDPEVWIQLALVVKTQNLYIHRKLRECFGQGHGGGKRCELVC